jgi:hypothetical protein
MVAAALGSSAELQAAIEQLQAARFDEEAELKAILRERRIQDVVVIRELRERQLRRLLAQSQA